jgi:Icc-related predicted phosphoesterase
LKFLCLSDYCGASKLLPFLPVMIQAEQPDYIFYCGGSMKGEVRLSEYETARKFHSKPDITSPTIQKETGEDLEHLKQFLLTLTDTQKIIFVVPGYNDAPEALYFKTVYSYANIYPNLRTVHEMMFREDPFWVAGFGGDITLSEDNRELVLQYSSTWAEFSLRRLEYFPGEKILLFHSPPVCRLDVSNGEHYGILLINEIIERVSPQLVMCGRAKSGQGMVKLGNTVVVNPGPLCEGNYAIIDYPSLEIQFKNLKNF